MLALWNFRAYVSPTGRRSFEQWYNQIDPAAQAEFDTMVEFLSQRSRDEWRRPAFDLLSGKFRDIGELRFKAQKIVFRPFGFFGPQRQEFTFLVGATKKGQVYDPKSAKETALTRMREIQSGNGSVHVWVL
jgi:hypothetical protein